jgi:hypothetical protein
MVLDWRSWAAAVCLVGLPACSNPWYLVESTYQVRPLAGKPPEVVTTPAYHRLVKGRVSTVALRAPDWCAGRSVAETTGEAHARGRLLRTNCGVEMAELESALVSAGYRVISWGVIKQMRMRELDALEACKKLGAEVLFQVNSLEESEISRGQDQWHRVFYESNRRGERGSRAVVPEERADALDAGVWEDELAAQPRSQMSVTLNATVVLVESGEAIWFYESTHAEGYHPALHSVTTERLFECKKGVLYRCVKRHMRGKRTDSASGSRSRGIGARHSTAQDVDAARTAAYYALVKEAVDALVREFGN